MSNHLGKNKRKCSSKMNEAILHVKLIRKKSRKREEIFLTEKNQTNFNLFHRRKISKSIFDEIF